MAAMTTVLTEFSDSQNSRTYALASHSAVRPNLVIQKRKVPSGNTGTIETIVAVIHGTVDEDGLPISGKVAAEVSFRYPINIGSTETDISEVLATLRDIIAGDEFSNSVSTQEWLS